MCWKQHENQNQKKFEEELRWQSNRGGSQACLVLQTQLDDYQIILDTQKIQSEDWENKPHNWRERRGHTVEGRRCGEVIQGRSRSWVLQKSGSPGCRERQERETAECSTQGSSQGKHFPKLLIRKMRGADFCEILQLASLKDWSFRGLQHGWCGALRTLQCSCGQPRFRQCSLRIPWDTLEEMVTHFLECIWEKWHCLSKDNGA